MSRGWPAPLRLVVDSSVVAKWFLADEPDAHAARDLRDALSDGAVRLVAPELLLLEVANAVLRSASDALDAAEVVRLIGDVGVELVACGNLAEEAVRLAAAYAITPYDAVFAALAREFEVPLVTADRRLAESGACEARLLGK